MNLAVKPQLSLSFHWGTKEFRNHRIHLSRHKVARWLKCALASNAEIAVRIVDAHEGRALNQQFRRKDYATNILTFNYTHQPVVVADLVLCAPIIEQEAAEQGKTLTAHYAHMLVHGALHAQGWNHIETKEAKKMELLEKQLMQALGFDDPYHCKTLESLLA